MAATTSHNHDVSVAARSAGGSSDVFASSKSFTSTIASSTSSISQGGSPRTVSVRTQTNGYRICLGWILIKKARSAKGAVLSSDGGSATSTTSIAFICTVDRNQREDWYPLSDPGFGTARIASRLTSIAPCSGSATSLPKISRRVSPSITLSKYNGIARLNGPLIDCDWLCSLPL